MQSAPSHGTATGKVSKELTTPTKKDRQVIKTVLKSKAGSAPVKGAPQGPTSTKKSQNCKTQAIKTVTKAKAGSGIVKAAPTARPGIRANDQVAIEKEPKKKLTVMKAKSRSSFVAKGSRTLCKQTVQEIRPAMKAKTGSSTTKATPKASVAVEKCTKKMPVVTSKVSKKAGTKMAMKMKSCSIVAEKLPKSKVRGAKAILKTIKTVTKAKSLTGVAKLGGDASSAGEKVAKEQAKVKALEVALMKAKAKALQEKAKLRAKAAEEKAKVVALAAKEKEKAKAKAGALAAKEKELAAKEKDKAKAKADASAAKEKDKAKAEKEKARAAAQAAKEEAKADARYARDLKKYEEWKAKDNAEMVKAIGMVAELEARETAKKKKAKADQQADSEDSEDEEDENEESVEEE